MEEIFKSHPFAVSIVGGVSLAVVSVLLCHVALWAWDCLSDFSLRGLFHRKYRKGVPTHRFGMPDPASGLSLSPTRRVGPETAPFKNLRGDQPWTQKTRTR
jgi:hypothetical protein